MMNRPSGNGAKKMKFGRMVRATATLGAGLSIAISSAQAQLVRTGSWTRRGIHSGGGRSVPFGPGSPESQCCRLVRNGSTRNQLDGVPDGFAAPNDLPGDFFNINSPRGAVFATPGSSVQVSADGVNPTGSPLNFGNINASYAATFATFSAQRLFSPIGSNIVDLTFFVPGSDAPALTRGFGAVYTDVDVADDTAFEYFDADGYSLGTFFFSPAYDQGLSFLGVSFDAPVVNRVRIRSGNSPLGPNDGGAIDVAVMDDMIYGEPVAVPEPSALLSVVSVLPSLRILQKRRAANAGS